MIDSIYKGKTDKKLLAEGFGMYVTRDNVGELMEILKEQAINFDLPVNTYSATINRTDEE